MLKNSWCEGAACFAHVSGHKAWPCVVSYNTVFLNFIYIFITIFLYHKELFYKKSVLNFYISRFYVDSQCKISPPLSSRIFLRERVRVSQFSTVICVKNIFAHYQFSFFSFFIFFPLNLYIDGIKTSTRWNCIYLDIKRFKIPSKNIFQQRVLNLTMRIQMQSSTSFCLSNATNSS